MNQKLLSGLTAALLISSFGLAPSGYADQSKSAEPESRVDASESGIAAQSTTISRRVISENPPESSSPNTALSQNPDLPDATDTANSSDGEASQKVSSSAPTQTAASAPALATSEANRTSSTTSIASAEVVKVGEYQSEDNRSNGIATIQPHLLNGKNAATLYVRNIPVLTFLGGTPAADTRQSAEPFAEVKVASVQMPSAQAGNAATVAAVQTPDSVDRSNKSGAPLLDPDLSDVAANSVRSTPSNSGTADSRDPVWRATTTAARLNQLYRDNVNADDIKIAWDDDRQQYVIKASDTEIVAVDEGIVLPDTTENAPGDLLQATNRIRRQMGGASPLSGIESDPNGVRQVSLGRLNLRVTGYASWYGPGFDGNYSASGEVFNQEALTAAHPSLPFGTQVRVTNADNGQSVVVRINDRGPYAHDRVIDLSTGAARVIGLINSGVAPVSLEVLGTAQAVN